MALIKKEWQRFAPNYPFEYVFLDDQIDAMYRTGEKVGQIAGILTALAIFIACMGLFGLAAYDTLRRTKEIGIRKILGASVCGIVLMLSKDFAKPVILANIFAWPVAYYVTNLWLQYIAYRVNLNMGVFVSGSLLALIIAIATVSYQAVKSAYANPVDALRNE